MDRLHTRFAKLVREGYTLECYWSNNAGCKRHKASSSFRDGEPDSFDPDDYEEWYWPTSCDTCTDGVPDPDKCVRKITIVRKYNTPSGDLEPGCLYWNTWIPEDYFWDNHKGPHLAVVAPNGFRWVIDSQAANCRRPSSRHHRCWAWEGDPVAGIVTLIHDERTCNPPIVTLGSWTGTLENGIFLPKKTSDTSSIISTY